MLQLFIWSPLPGDITTNRLESLQHVISEERKEKIAKSTSLKRTFKHTMSETLVRYSILKTSTIKNSDIQFSYNQFGKPFLKNHAVEFNLSHSGEFTVCGVSSSVVGVDIQKVKENINIEALQNFITPAELQWIISSENKALAFAQIWALKESYLKLLGTGLQKPLRSFSVFKAHNKFQIKDKTHGDKVFFHTFSPKNNYQLAICSYEEELLKIHWITTDQLIEAFTQTKN